MAVRCGPLSGGPDFGVQSTILAGIHRGGFPDSSAEQAGYNMSQTLCKIKKLLKKDLKVYVQHVKDPRYVCRSCGRVANDKDLLCKAVKIKSL